MIGKFERGEQIGPWVYHLVPSWRIGEHHPPLVDDGDSIVKSSCPKEARGLCGTNRTSYVLLMCYLIDTVEREKRNGQVQ